MAIDKQEADVAKDLEVVGNGGLAHVDGVHNLVDRQSPALGREKTIVIAAVAGSAMAASRSAEYGAERVEA